MLYLTLSAVAEDVVAASSNGVERLSRVNGGKIDNPEAPGNCGYVSNFAAGSN